MMAARFILFTLLLLAEYSLGSAPAFAVKRPGAPRPLRVETAGQSAGNIWLTGIEPLASGATICFAGQDALGRVQVASRVDNSDNKSAWKLTSRSLLADQLPNPQLISPDGKYVAFASTRSGLEAVYVRATNQSEASARRVATLARFPRWLDESTLLYESTRPGRIGLFEISVADLGAAEMPAPQMWFAKAGEAAVSPDRQSVCVAARDERTKATQLYLLAADGSGARAIAQTEGARRPCFSPSGDAIFFDAPAPREENAAPVANAETTRVIWMTPLISTPPAAQITAVKARPDGSAEIWGTAFSEAGAALNMQLEIGRSDGNNSAVNNVAENSVADSVGAENPGDEVLSWKKLETRMAPIHSGVLALWQPAAQDNNAALNLRLTVTDADGDRAQSTLAFNWPLSPLATGNVILPSLFGTQPERYGLETTPAAPTAELPQTTNPEIAAPAAAINQVATNETATPVNGTVRLPLPSPAIAPVIAPVPGIRPRITSTPRIAPPVKSNSGALPYEALPRMAQAPVRAQNRPQTTPRPTAAPPTVKAQAVKARVIKTQAIKAQPTPVPVATPAAPKNNGGIPSQMKVGTSVPVTVVLRNTGSRVWSSQGESPVRLIYRWVDARTNIRHRWAVKWLRETVPPGKSTRLKFDLEAPTRAGDFILTYALVRLNEQNYKGGKYTPPPTKTNDHRWPGEFGAVSFRIKVNP